MRVPDTVFGQHVWFRLHPEIDHRALAQRSTEVRTRRSRPRRSQDDAR